MQAETNAKTTILQVSDGNSYEIINKVDEVAIFIYDNFILPDTFIQFLFPDGLKLNIKKKCIIAFYESE